MKVLIACEYSGAVREALNESVDMMLGVVTCYPLMMVANTIFKRVTVGLS